MTTPLSFIDRVLFWLGMPKRAAGTCVFCRKNGRMIDLGDGDLICDRCWENWE